MQNAKEGANPKSTRPHVEPAWRWMGERGLQVATGADTLARYELLSSYNFAEIEDIIPADGSLLLILKHAAAAPAELRALLAAPLSSVLSKKGVLHTLPVEYGGDGGPDLTALAMQAGMHPVDYINRHAAAEYTVAFLGFQPGFPYLLGLPVELRAARRATPRTRVAAGSVAIGGAYAGIYPFEGPGGWSIVGRTTAVLFDPTREPPALLKPGDRVRFVPA